MLKAGIIALAMQQATLPVPPLPANGPPSIIVGADFSRKCLSRDEAERLYCAAYVAGMHDTLNAVYDERLYCLPASAAQISVGQIAARRIEARPDLWSQPAVQAVTVALSEAFPCVT